jgi:hypothetical protein
MSHTPLTDYCYYYYIYSTQTTTLPAATTTINYHYNTSYTMYSTLDPRTVNNALKYTSIYTCCFSQFLGVFPYY